MPLRTPICYTRDIRILDIDGHKRPETHSITEGQSFDTQSNISDTRYLYPDFLHADRLRTSTRRRSSQAEVRLVSPVNFTRRIHP